MSIQAEIQRLAEEKSSIHSRIEKLQGMLALYPDLVREAGPKGIRYTSASIAAIALAFDIEDSCECCRDPSIQVWPYVPTPFGKIYSSSGISVGTRIKHEVVGSHCVINSWWKRSLKEALMPEEIIEDIHQRLLAMGAEHNSSVHFNTRIPQ